MAYAQMKCPLCGIPMFLVVPSGTPLVVMVQGLRPLLPIKGDHFCPECSRCFHIEVLWELEKPH